MLSVFGVLTKESTQASPDLSGLDLFQIGTAIKANAIIYSGKDLYCYMKSREVGTYFDAFVSGWLAVLSDLQRLGFPDHLS